MINQNATPPLRPQFWETVDLTNMTKLEWESLCDGCGKCCLLKLEDEDTEEIKFTNVACRLFDDTTCKCQNYALRKQMGGRMCSFNSRKHRTNCILDANNMRLPPRI